LGLTSDHDITHFQKRDHPKGDRIQQSPRSMGKAWEGRGKLRGAATECPPAAAQGNRLSKRKRTNSRWSSMGINYSANRPGPDDPGGLGAEESGVERTGPTQNLLLAIQQGGRLAEVGRYYDCANDPVTDFDVQLLSEFGTAPRYRPLAAKVSRRDHVMNGMIPTHGAASLDPGFEDEVMPLTTGDTP
jgi:hypothetical protein